MATEFHNHLTGDGREAVTPRKDMRRVLMGNRRTNAKLFSGKSSQENKILIDCTRTEDTE